MNIEQGPIRPPSEAASLLIRVTRNCPWNKCTFCSTYKGKKFSRRPIEEVLRDVDTVRRVSEQVRQISRSKGFGGKITSEVVNESGARYGHLHYHVASWLYYGGKSVFLQDANSLLLKTSDLVEIINYIRTAFPSVERVTTYARADTAARKNDEDFLALGNAGLSRIHMGMESGSDIVLKMVQKGITSSQLIQAAQKIRGAGISLCWYIMPGLGGKEHSSEHALGTAEVINAGNPDYVRFRTLSVLKRTPLYDMVQSGIFTVPDEDDMVEEQRLIIQSLNGVTTTIVSDHVLNLLQELEGTLPVDREKMLNIIARYLALPQEAKNNYQLGRRAGVYLKLDDMQNKNRFNYVQSLLSQIGGPENINKELAKIRRGFV
ncbi:Radical SAM superfamily protein [Desulfotomaculum arcticum]|uniref:Radical SAM superfamily protein n=1 Tax=Desulfotruncus arcticus DSM 17038 TaxID=1121424 RepID=A0A1I2QF32_9FIRM|nr:radical SAM protein [Desulfotruncus arcticus]SFG27155.1 Radical SAM superfamily protein [Desulfotomaculum arcticum] [Desulfotruncus arcticus DSM 17038]